MQILHIIQCTNLGGMERVALTMTRNLQERGHRCRWISLNPIGNLGPLLEEAKVSCVGLQYHGPWGALGVPAMRRAFRSGPCDAVIMTGPNLSAMLALGRRRDEPRMLTVHHYHAGVKPLWEWRAIYAAALKRFHVVTFPSDFIRREAERIYPPIAAISKTLRNPIVVPPLPAREERLEARKRLGIPLSTPVIGNAGRLIPQKRFDVFLRVAASVASCIPEAVFVIAGDGPERRNLEQVAHELGVEQSVRWLGWQTDLTDFYLSLDILLFNTDWDAFPTTPLEAMSYSIPVVASVIHSGLDEVISSQAYGFVLKRHDVPALTEQVKRFIAEPDGVAQAGRRRVLEMLNPETCTSRTLEELEVIRPA